MASVIKAGNATDGVQVTSDNTGILELKTGTGAGTTAMTIGTDQSVTFAAGTSINGITVGRGGGSVSTNTAVGASALAANTTGLQNTVLGASALTTNTSGSGNTGLGWASLNANSTGSFNSAVGRSSLGSNETGSNNTALGYQALVFNTTASNNTAVGYQAGYSNTTGTGNVFLGNQAGLAVTTSNGQTFIGNSAGAAKTTGGNNTFVGASAGGSATTGTGNTFVGVNDTTNGAGYSVTTGSKNTIIGGYTGSAAPISATGSNFVVLSDGDGNVVATLKSAGGIFEAVSAAGAGTNTMKYNTNNGRITYDTSSARYKDNIRDSGYGLSHVMQMRSTMFEYKDTGRTDVGLIAEELDLIIPELVTKNAEGQPDAVSYDRMVSVLVKAIQELKTEFDAYKEAHP